MRVKRRIWFGTAITVLAILLAVLTSLWSAKAPAPAPDPPALRVDVARVISQPVKDWRVYTGQLEAVEQVAVRPLVSGTVTGVHFTDGQLVDKGSLLFTIDPLPYQAALDRAAALRAQAAARVEYSRSQFFRARQLLASNAISKEDAETRQDAVNESEANLLAAEAALSAARLDLAHTRIAAPIRGRVSRALITPGNVVNATASDGQTLATIVSVSPIYAWFGMDEATYLRVVAASGRFAESEVLLALATDASFTRSGRIHDIDNKLDPDAGTVRVRAVFDNPKGDLLPGLLARVRLSVGPSRPGLLVSDAAVGIDQDKKYVLVVDDDNRARYQEVTVAGEQDGLRVVTAGLREGERVVVNGTQRAKAGDLVTPALVEMPRFLEGRPVLPSGPAREATVASAAPRRP